MSALSRHNVTIRGQDAQALIFAHGYGCDQNVWRHVASSFEKDFKVVLFDYVGAGGSDLEAYSYVHHGTLEGHALDVLALCEEAQLERPIFVGHSVSAMIAVVAARLKPDLFDKLVLMAPNPCYIDDGDYQGGFSRDDIDGLLDTLDSNFFSWAQMMAPVIMGNSDRPELGEELANSFCSVDPIIARHAARVTFLSDSREDLAHVFTPSLIMQCADDALASQAVGDYVKNRLTNSQLVRLKATGHCPHLSAHAEIVAELKRFISEN